MASRILVADFSADHEPVLTPVPFTTGGLPGRELISDGCERHRTRPGGKTHSLTQGLSLRQTATPTMSGAWRWRPYARHLRRSKLGGSGRLRVAAKGGGVTRVSGP